MKKINTKILKVAVQDCSELVEYGIGIEIDNLIDFVSLFNTIVNLEEFRSIDALSWKNYELLRNNLSYFTTINKEKDHLEFEYFSIAIKLLDVVTKLDLINFPFHGLVISINLIKSSEESKEFNISIHVGRKYFSMDDSETYCQFEKSVQNFLNLVYPNGMYNRLQYECREDICTTDNTIIDNSNNNTSHTTNLKTSGERYKNELGGNRDSSKGKLNFNLIPYNALKRTAKRYLDGAEEYGKNNWHLMSTPEDIDRYKESSLRHLLQYQNGEVDEDHAAAAIWNIMASMYYEDLK